MKKNLPFLFSAAVLAWGLAGCASPSGEKPVASHTLETHHPLPIDLPLRDGDDTAPPALFERSIATSAEGLSEGEVMQMLGSAAQRLTPEIWIYWRYYSPEKAAATGGHDTLVVAFARGKVLGMKLVNGDVLRADLAKRPSARPNQL